MLDIYFSYKVHHIGRITNLESYFYELPMIYYVFSKKTTIIRIKYNPIQKYHKFDMQYFYTVYLLLRSLPKLVSSILELYFSSYDFWKPLKNFCKSISKTLLNPTGRKCYAHPAATPQLHAEE
jgi:hypothetical protein